MIDLTNTRVLVTGGKGFLGRHICDLLQTKYEAKPLSYSSKEYDLTCPSETQDMFEKSRPDYVIHCAGFNGGVAFNREYPADIFAKNTLMGINVHKECVIEDVEKVISIITSCAHPDLGQDVLKEEDLWNGPCNPSVSCHGYAKRTLQVCADTFNREYGLNAVTCCVNNLFGKEDSFNLEKTKVVGALIRKVVEAHQDKQRKIIGWGTGQPKREFMYVRDAADAIIQALIKYDVHTQPLNIGSGQETSVKELMGAIIDIVGYEGEIEWDTSKGDGQMRKLLDTSNMRKLLDVEITDFKVALRNTIEWYINNKEEADEK